MQVKINNGEDLSTGVCYRSPNAALFGKDNDLLPRDLINEIRGKPLLLMGNFNFPDIDWDSTPMSNKFVDCVDEAFLTQHAT